jgi:hypothetical protein
LGWVDHLLTGIVNGAKLGEEISEGHHFIAMGVTFIAMGVTFCVMEHFWLTPTCVSSAIGDSSLDTVPYVLR